MDATIYGSGTLNNASAPGPALNDFFTLKVELGPFGSLWGVDLVHQVGPNFGKADFYWATATDDGDFAGTIQDPSALTYVKHPLSTTDFYSAGAASNVVIDRVGIFRIKGQPGDPLTAFSVDPDTGFRAGDGGPGLYYLMVKMGSKNVASTNYKLGLQELAIERLGDIFL